MKKTAVVAALIAAVLVIIFLVCTVRTDTTPYFQTTYYRESCSSSDSLAEAATTVRDSLFAGFARISLTPVLGSAADDPVKGEFREVPLAGYGDRKGKPATAIHDSIFVKAVALKAGGEMIVIVSADLLLIPPNVTDSVMKLLSAKGIHRNQVYFAATHSHSSLGGWGPGFVGELFAGRENDNLITFLSGRIAAAVITATAELRPAEIGSGSFLAGNFTRNRLVGEAGTRNEAFSFFIVRQPGGREAVIGSFPAHATTLGDENMEISGDYPGYWARAAEKGGAYMAMFCAGSVGSQSPAGDGTGFEKPKLIGESLADSLMIHMKDVQMKRVVNFSAASLRISLPEYNMRLTTRINLASFLSRRLMQKPENVYLQALRIDSTIWISTPGDFSGEYALQIRNNLAVKGFNSNITSFNGKYVGYIIPGRYYYLDEYESKIMGWFGPNMGDYTMDMISRLTRIVTSDN